MSAKQFITVATDKAIPAPDGYVSSVVFGMCDGICINGAWVTGRPYNTTFEGINGLTAKDLVMAISASKPDFVDVGGIMIPVSAITGICDAMVPPEGSINASGLDLEEILQTNLDAIRASRRADAEESLNA